MPHKDADLTANASTISGDRHNTSKKKINQQSQEGLTVNLQNLLLQNLSIGQKIVFKGKSGEFTGTQPGDLPCALVKFEQELEQVSGADILEIGLQQYEKFAVGDAVLYQDSLTKLQVIKFCGEVQEWLPVIGDSFVDWHEIAIAPDLTAVRQQPELVQQILRELLTKAEVIDDLDLAMSVGDITLFELKKALQPVVDAGVLQYTMAGYLIPQNIKQILSDLLDSKPPKPELPEDAPIAVVLCAGGGGVEAGMIAAGIRPVVAIEMNPQKPKLSHAMCDVHETNFGSYGCKVIRQSVQEVALAGFPDIPRYPNFLHVSPMCSNFSNAQVAAETEEDIAVAVSVVSAIEQLQPENFTLENVRSYSKSESFALIQKCLERQGYQVWYEVVKMADLGLPQSRERLILTASKSGAWNFTYKQSEPVGWYEAIGHLIDQMPDSDLSADQEASIMEYLRENEPTPLLVQRVGARDNKCKIRAAHEPCFTLTRSIFTDQNGNNRNRFLDIWLPDGTSKAVTLEAAAILEGFPEWYEFTGEPWIDGSVIGYSVPPNFATQLFASAPKDSEAPDPNNYADFASFAAAWQRWVDEQSDEAEEELAHISAQEVWQQNKKSSEFALGKLVYLKAERNALYKIVKVDGEILDLELFENNNQNFIKNRQVETWQVKLFDQQEYADFKIGDRVFVRGYGEGEVTKVACDGIWVKEDNEKFDFCRGIEQLRLLPSQLESYPDPDESREKYNELQAQHDAAPPRSPERKNLAPLVKAAKEARDAVQSKIHEILAKETQNAPDPEDYSWIVSCSAGDINTKSAIEQASLEQLKYALENLQKPNHPGAQKTRIQAIASQIKKLEKSVTPPTGDF